MLVLAACLRTPSVAVDAQYLSGLEQPSRRRAFEGREEHRAKCVCVWMGGEDIAGTISVGGATRAMVWAH